LATYLLITPVTTSSYTVATPSTRCTHAWTGHNCFTSWSTNTYWTAVLNTIAPTWRKMLSA